MWKEILNMLIEFLLFVGTLVTIACLIIFMFISTKAWMAILAGMSAANALYLYDKYRRKDLDINKK